METLAESVRNCK